MNYMILFQNLVNPDNLVILSEKFPKLYMWALPWVARAMR